MRPNRLKKVCVKLIMAVFLFCGMPMIMEETVRAEMSDNDIVVCADRIGWKYKNINGKPYKRLYNFSKDQWIGNWIPV